MYDKKTKTRIQTNYYKTQEEALAALSSKLFSSGTVAEQMRTTVSVEALKVAFDALKEELSSSDLRRAEEEVARAQIASEVAVLRERIAFQARELETLRSRLQQVQPDVSPRTDSRRGGSGDVDALARSFQRSIEACRDVNGMRGFSSSAMNFILSHHKDAPCMAEGVGTRMKAIELVDEVEVCSLRKALVIKQKGRGVMAYYGYPFNNRFDAAEQFFFRLIENTQYDYIITRADGKCGSHAINFLVESMKQKDSHAPSIVQQNINDWGIDDIITMVARFHGYSEKLSCLNLFCKYSTKVAETRMILLAHTDIEEGLHTLDELKRALASPSSPDFVLLSMLMDNAITSPTDTVSPIAHYALIVQKEKHAEIRSSGWFRHWADSSTYPFGDSSADHA